MTKTKMSAGKTTKRKKTKDIWKDHKSTPLRTSYGGSFFKSQMEQREQRKTWMFSNKDIRKANKKEVK